jgi:hypothetical protein
MRGTWGLCIGRKALGAEQARVGVLLLDRIPLGRQWSRGSHSDWYRGMYSWHRASRVDLLLLHSIGSCTQY